MKNHPAAPRALPNGYVAMTEWRRLRERLAGLLDGAEWGQLAGRAPTLARRKDF